MSQAWFPSKSDFIKIESTQRRATSWILNFPESTYHQRLLVLNLLPMSLYIQINDLMTLSKINSSSFDFDWFALVTNTNIADHGCSMRISQLFKLPRNRLVKTNRNFWHRTPRLANALLSWVKFMQNKGLKSRLLNFIWSYSKNNYNIDDPCSWRMACSISNCIERDPRLYFLHRV